MEKPPLKAGYQNKNWVCLVTSPDDLFYHACKIKP